MKRPIPIYFIATWWLLTFTLQIGPLARHLKSRLPEWLIPEEQLAATSGLLSILIVWLVIWHLVRLVQLRFFNRWFSVAYFLWCTFALTWNMMVISQRVQRPFRLIISFSIFGLLNLTSALYLMNRRFRKLAVQFVAEREKDKHSRMMQKCAEKAILKDLKG